MSIGPDSATLVAGAEKEPNVGDSCTRADCADIVGSESIAFSPILYVSGAPEHAESDDLGPELAGASRAATPLQAEAEWPFLETMVPYYNPVLPWEWCFLEFWHMRSRTERRNIEWSAGTTI